MGGGGTTQRLGRGLARPFLSFDCLYAQILELFFALVYSDFLTGSVRYQTSAFPNFFVQHRRINNYAMDLFCSYFYAFS